MSEIIIDDVNVEECSYYNKDNAPYCCEVWDNECKAQNCYYKQLKRLQAENEKLKHKCEVYHQCDEMIKNTYRQAYKKVMELTKENEQLKKRQITKNGFICDCEQNAKYKQALEEIREMAEYDCQYECSNNCENCTIESCLEKRIQRKIDEVLR